MNKSVAALLAAAPTTEVAHALLGLVQDPTRVNSTRPQGLFGFADVERYLTARRFKHAAYVTGALTDPGDLDRVALATRDPQVLRAVCYNRRTTWARLLELCFDTNKGVAQTARRVMGGRLGGKYFHGTRKDLRLVVQTGDGDIPIAALIELAARQPLPGEVIAALLWCETLPEEMQLLVARFADRSSLMQLSSRKDLTLAAADLILKRSRTDFKRTKMVDHLTSGPMLASEKVRAALRLRADLETKSAVLNSCAPLSEKERTELLNVLLPVQHSLQGLRQISLAAIARPVWTSGMLDRIDARCVYTLTERTNVFGQATMNAAHGVSTEVLRCVKPSLLNPLRSREVVLEALDHESAVFVYFNENLTGEDRAGILKRFGVDILRRIVRDGSLFRRYDEALFGALVDLYGQAERTDRWWLSGTVVRLGRESEVPLGQLERLSIAELAEYQVANLGIGRCVKARFGDDPAAWTMTAQLGENWQCSVGSLLDAVEGLI
jgi:hypothetical protein